MKATLPIQFLDVYGHFTIEDAAGEAIRLARVLNVYVCFQFNGVECHLGEHANIQVVACEYLEEHAKREGPKLVMIG